MVKIGLEIHQQLDTRKLFCSCPSEIIDTEPDFKIKRQLKLSFSELGEIDKAALHEINKQKWFVYYGYHKTTCLVETDEEPPHTMNKEALEVALQVAKALNAKIADEIIVMRKIVLDGSNTSGFQRTALIATDGYIELNKKRISIPSICLEEDAAKIVKRTAGYDVYNLSRLGIPLIEITTSPDIKDGKECKEIAEYIGMILRSTGRVKRGIGTIRQDINISVPGGARVELKGAQNLRIMEKIVNYEIQRQKELIKIGKKIKKMPEIVDLTLIFRDTKSKIIANSLKKNGVVLGIKIKNFNGILGHEIQPGRRVGTEISDYAKVKAGISGLFHSDELPAYGITDEEVQRVKNSLKTGPNDGFIILTEVKQKAVNAMKAVMERISMLDIVPEEVRKVNEDGTSSYLRPLSGSSRMYPETDIPPIKPDFKIKPIILLTHRIKELVKRFHLSNDLAKHLVKSPYLDFVLELFNKYKIKPSFIAEIVLTAEKTIKKEFNKDIVVPEHAFHELFNALSKDKISKDSVFSVLSELDSMPIEDAIKKYSTVSDEELEKYIKIIAKESNNFGYLMGLIMKKFKGCISGKRASELLRKYLKC